MAKFLIVHTLRNFGPSNLNRGKDGEPKFVYFGGERRGRISSQSIKRAIRRSSAFDEFRERGQMDIRTRRLPLLLMDELEALGLNGTDLDRVVERVHEFGRRADDKTKQKKAGQTNQLILLSPRGATQLAEQIYQAYQSPEWDTTNMEKMGLRLTDIGVDTALFGSMTTSSVFPRVEGACMVSHAFSTNRTSRSIDYFAAVDDLAADDPEAGSVSGMVEEVEFNSNCYYWTLAVDLEKLSHNLNGDTDLAREVLGALLEGIVVANPSGKQNTFASHPLPAMMMIERRDLVFDYADAFVKPVEPVRKPVRSEANDEPEKPEADLVAESVNVLGAHMRWCDSTYPYPAERLCLVRPTDNPPCETSESLPELIAWATR